MIWLSLIDIPIPEFSHIQTIKGFRGRWYFHLLIGYDRAYQGENSECSFAVIKAEAIIPFFIFHNLDRSWLRRIIQQRVNEGGILRLIGRWLKAGVLEDGLVTYLERGTPQGDVISPLLSNIFLHHVLDDWFVREVQPRLEGRCFLIRFADDFVIGCEWEADARRVMEILPKRFGRFGLTIHPGETVLTRFSRPMGVGNSAKGSGTFDFLGFTHYWGKSRRGTWVIKRKTKKKSLRRFYSKVFHQFSRRLETWPLRLMGSPPNCFACFENGSDRLQDHLRG